MFTDSDSMQCATGRVIMTCKGCGHPKHFPSCPVPPHKMTLRVVKSPTHNSSVEMDIAPLLKVMAGLCSLSVPNAV